MAKHSTDKDKASNNKALGLIRRGKIDEAAIVLTKTSNTNQSQIKQRILKAKDIKNGKQ